MKENMQKLFLVIGIALLVGCEQLMHGATQPVKLIDRIGNVYFTSCGGSSDDWGGCQARARQTCPKSFTVINRVEGVVDGKRELTFQCVK